MKSQKKIKNNEDKMETEQIQIDNSNLTLYHLLNVKSDASDNEIKKSYKKLALQLHPDKSDQKDAKENFQRLNDAYKILMDPQKRKIYDETGELDADLKPSDFQAAYEFYREIYKKINTSDIDNFAKQYRNSSAEIEDLIQFYNKNKGDLTYILHDIPLSENSDVQRFIKIYEDLINEKKIHHYKNLDKTKKSIRLLADEKHLVNDIKQNDLIQAIQNKKKNNINFVEMLENKYAKSSKNQPISDKEFNQIQQKMKKNK